jgi:hypothetical protein
MANSDKNIRITTSRNKATLPSIVFTGSSAGTSVLTLEVRDDNSIAFTGLDGDVFALDYDLSSGTIWSVNDKTGVPFLRTSFNGLIGIAEFGGTVGIGQTNPLYKLDVKGNVGFASTNDNSYSILIDNVSAAGSNSLQLRAANDLRFYNIGNTFYTGFQAGAATANTTYTWPLTSPASGTSVLQSDASGVMSWVAAAAGGGGGAGTVATPGAQYQIAGYYSGAGASVAGSTTFTNNTAAGIVTVAHTTNSTSLTTGALVVSGGAGFAKTIFVGDNINIFKSGSAGALRLWNSANSFYTGLQAGAPSANTTYTLPIAFPGSGTSVLASDTSGIMSWIASGGGSGTVTSLTAGSGITFSTGTTITTTGTIRAKRPLVISFCTGYTPTASGADTNVIRIPDSATDGTTALTYIPREFHIRVETPSAGTSTIQLEKYTGTSAFSGTAVTSLSITGGAVYEVQSSVFAAAGLALTSGDKMRINFTALNATHANFSVTLELEEF